MSYLLQFLLPDIACLAFNENITSHAKRQENNTVLRDKAESESNSDMTQIWRLTDRKI